MAWLAANGFALGFASWWVNVNFDTLKCYCNRTAGPLLKEIYLGVSCLFCLLWITLVRLLLLLVLLPIASVSFVKSTFGNCKAAKFYLGGLANHLHISSHTSCFVSAIVHLQSKLFVIPIQNMPLVHLQLKVFLMMKKKWESPPSGQ